MYVKKLELVGFKSFADRTCLEFESGITAIVGPNGCGKSNVSDAIKWVLGDQSPRSMRGDSMEDVIFSGTALREPVNFAEISLTFANESRELPIDYEEVVIARRLYRSGDSEYLLNRNAVRLKDIHQLLAGTGLGMGNYSVIEQGRISLILNSKPEEIRMLLEEAAGITRFRNDKREALRKLDLTEQNLLRVGDITKEIQRQVKSIERQARKAEAFKREYENLKRCETERARQDLKERESRYKGLQGVLEEGRHRRDMTIEALETTNRLLLKTRQDFQECEKAINEVHTRQALLEQELKNDQEKIDLHRKRVEESRVRSQEIAEEVHRRDAHIQELEADLRERERQVDLIVREEATGQSRLDSAEGELRLLESHLRDKQAEMGECKARLVENAQAQSRSENDLAQTRSTHQSHRARRDRLKIERMKAEEEWEGIKKRLDCAKEKAAGLSQEIRQRAVEKETLEKAFLEVETTAARCRENISHITNEYASRESRLEMLRELVLKHEGFSQGVRHLLKAMDQTSDLKKGILGTLAHLVDVERGYELALETALEAMAQAVVCLTEEDLLKAREFLKSSQRGRATFVNLESFSQIHPAKPRIIELSREVRPLSDFVRPHESVERFMHALLEGVFVAPNGETAVELWRKHPTLRFVTPQGEFFREGILVGGTTDTSEEGLIFGRRNRIRDIEEKLVELGLEKDRLLKEMSRLANDEQELDQRIKALGVLLPKLQVELADSTKERDHLEKTNQKIDEERSTIDCELGELCSEIEEAERKLSSLNEAIESLKREEGVLQDSLGACQLALEQGSKRKEELIIELTRIRSAWETLVQRKERSQQDLDLCKRALESEETAKASYLREGEESLRRSEEAEKLIADLDERNRLSRMEVARLAGERNEALEKRDRSSRALRDLEIEKKREEDEALKTQKLSHETELELNEIKHAMDRIMDRMMSTYQVDLKDGNFTADEAQARQKVLNDTELEKLREKVQRMGPVNLVAIEEHGELVKRHAFLVREHEDLTRAKEDVHKTLARINRTTREMFIDVYSKVRTHFTEYFKLLFGGGTADLVLLNERDVLESGVDVVAKPPGKKLQTISLLSGGEKALAAIALLFAMFKVKPSPFCVLDEIDAPLDDTNIQRFATVLKDFIKGSQFVIITHNKRTMAIANILYGITMHESGISRIVSVKFSEEDKEPQKRPSGRVLV